MMRLHFFKENNSYHNFLVINSDNREEMIPLLKDMNTNGDIWRLGNNYYPLIISKCTKQFPQAFTGHFFFRTFCDNGNPNNTLSIIQFQKMIDVCRNGIEMNGFYDDNNYSGFFQKWYNDTRNSVTFGGEYIPEELKL